MGASQSVITQTQNHNLYTLLNVERNASIDDIRRAYKKMALKLHPDRNHGKEQEAATQFAKVVAAYEILVDPQEKEWYDRHDETADYTEYSAKVTKSSEIRQYLDPKFVASLDPQSDQFYNMASEFFEKLRNEEMEAAFEQNIPKEDVPTAEAPLLGHLGTKWPQIKAFYDVWTSFNTTKTFDWEDVYPIHHAEDRRSRRAMESRNKRVRDSAKKEFNDCVRSLVRQVYNLDVRVKAQQQKSKAKQKASASTAQQQQRQAHPRQQPQEYKELEWAKVEAASENETECIACDIQFDNPSELVAHELSTSHQKAFKEMQKQMLQEDAQLNDLTESTKKLGIDDIISSMDQHRTSKQTQKQQQQQQQPKKLSKAKLRKQQRLESQQGALNCRTCETKFDTREELEVHCQKSKHVMPVFRL